MKPTNKCPACDGRVTYTGFTNVECDNEKCTNWDRVVRLPDLDQPLTWDWYNIFGITNDVPTWTEANFYLFGFNYFTRRTAVGQFKAHFPNKEWKYPDEKAPGIYDSPVRV